MSNLPVCETSETDPLETSSDQRTAFNTGEPPKTTFMSWPGSASGRRVQPNMNKTRYHLLSSFSVAHHDREKYGGRSTSRISAPFLEADLRGSANSTSTAESTCDALVRLPYFVANTDRANLQGCDDPWLGPIEPDPRKSIVLHNSPANKGSHTTTTQTPGGGKARDKQRRDSTKHYTRGGQRCTGSMRAPICSQTRSRTMLIDHGDPTIINSFFLILHNLEN